MKKGMKGIRQLACQGVVRGFCAFLIFVFGAIFLVSIFLTLVLLSELCDGKPIPWYEIVAPIVMFFGIGILWVWSNN